MATRPKFAKMANYLCECVEASHIFLKNGLWRMSASLASPRKSAWGMSASLVSTCQVLAYDKVGRFRHKLHILYV